MKKFILALAALNFAGCANSSNIELEGKIAVKGSEPHAYLVIEDIKTDKNYKIANSNQFNLKNMQNKKVKLKVKLLKKALGPTFPAVVEVIDVKRD